MSVKETWDIDREEGQGNNQGETRATPGTGGGRTGQCQGCEDMVRIRKRIGPKKDDVVETNIKEWLKWEGAATMNKGQVAFITLFMHSFDFPTRPELWGMAYVTSPSYIQLQVHSRYLALILLNK